MESGKYKESRKKVESKKWKVEGKKNKVIVEEAAVAVAAKTIVTVIEDLMIVPVVPHKAVAEASKRGKL